MHPTTYLQSTKKRKWLCNIVRFKSRSEVHLLDRKLIIIVDFFPLHILNLRNSPWKLSCISGHLFFFFCLINQIIFYLQCFTSLRWFMIVLLELDQQYLSTIMILPEFLHLRKLIQARSIQNPVFKIECLVYHMMSNLCKHELYMRTYISSHNCM